MDGKEFINRMKEGDISLWDELHPKLNSYLINCVKKYFSDLSAESESIAAHVVGVLFERWHEFNGDCKVETFAYSIMKYHCYKLRRERDNFVNDFDIEAHNPSNEVADSHRQELRNCVEKILKALDQMPESNRKNGIPIIESIDWIIKNGKYKTKEFAKAWNISLSAAKHRKSVIQEVFMKQCKKHCEEELCAFGKTKELD